MLSWHIVCLCWKIVLPMKRLRSGRADRKKGLEKKRRKESIDPLPLQILPTQGSETESYPNSITVFKRDPPSCPCVQSFIINNKPETKDSPTHTHTHGTGDKGKLWPNNFFIWIFNIYYAYAVCGPVWRPAITLFEINARKYSLHLYKYIYSPKWK